MKITYLALCLIIPLLAIGVNGMATAEDVYLEDTESDVVYSPSLDNDPEDMWGTGHPYEAPEPEVQESPAPIADEDYVDVYYDDTSDTGYVDLSDTSDDTVWSPSLDNE